MAHFSGDKTAKVSVPKIKVNSTVQHIALFKNRDFLYEKYVEKGWSASQIAEEVGSVASTVVRHLKALSIPLRTHQRPLQRRPGHGLAYGRKVIERSEQVHQAEMVSIAKMTELRAQGFSYWKIADIFNSMGVPTKTRKAKWQAATVMKILKGQDRSGQPGPRNDA